MPLTPYRVILDTNILLRGLINSQGASGRILLACDLRRMVPMLSKPVLAEYRYILTAPTVVARYPELDARKVQVALAHLVYLGVMLQSVRQRFAYPRDPKDEMFIELAIAAKATHLITTDRDLLALPVGRDDASKRFRQRLPAIDVLEPEEFARRHGRELGIDRAEAP